jgi:pantoate--beta-alanine ligase
MLIQTMVHDLFMDVEIVPCATVRDSDGLALSSRNAYLCAEERIEALKISRALTRASHLVGKGIVGCDRLYAEMEAVLEPLEVEHVAIVSRAFVPIDTVEVGNTIILVEAVVGTTRLLDNVWI